MKLYLPTTMKFNKDKLFKSALNLNPSGCVDIDNIKHLINHFLLLLLVSAC